MRIVKETHFAVCTKTWRALLHKIWRNKQSSGFSVALL